ncbi:glycosyl transferase, group 1 family protein [Candidatus Accumulibacter phosphatis]|uniref:Glycosyl transferase, group 1 family protein n=1 Tax=Candidatus Accumulibacter phosphatis TaxID=327160 RepID=A0A5S4EH46_9PROT|nr:glycosyl transferase, group 1 family protein [Candidatus Accumulibacter phosphatis]
MGNVFRGHEVFARDLFTLLGDSVDITLFKGGGDAAPGELVIGNISRNASCLDDIHVATSPKWAASLKAQERCRIEGETFAYAALKPLLEGEFDVIHCLEREVCEIIYDKRHLFRTTPKILFSNGGAIPARDLPRCDFVQEHTELNLSYSAKGKSFLIPHGVDVELFSPEVVTDFRVRHGIPHDAFVVISVGAISYGHKRMDYVVREVAAVKGAFLLVAGQETKDTPEIISLGKQLMGDRIVFTTVQHRDLPKLYAAANVFTLGSVFETFGIVYIEAMAMGLPVICTNHKNQRAIVKEGIFIDVTRSGALTQAIRDTDRASLSALGQRGREIVLQSYDIRVLKSQYIERYQAIASSSVSLPNYSLKNRLASNAKNAIQGIVRLIFGRAE